MKILLKFKSGTRYVGETGLLVLPENPNTIIEKISLEKATDEEIKNLKANPHNDLLLEKIKKRG